MIEKETLKIEVLLEESKNIVFLTGAGISTNSGIPDFRSDNGFWKSNKPIMFRDFLNNHSARQLSWERNITLNETIQRIKPNKGHLFVKEVLDKKEGYVITQNIDGLHHRSGVNKDRIIEVHGNATKAKCLDCEKELSIKLFHNAVSNNKEIPNCPACFGLVKVATISFGQPMNMDDFEKSKDKIIESDILIVLGSSLQVQPVASLPGFAVQNGKKLIIINKDPTNFDQYAEVCIHEDICSTVATINI